MTQHDHTPALPPLGATTRQTEHGPQPILYLSADYARQLLDELRAAPRTPAVTRLGQALVQILNDVRKSQP